MKITNTFMSLETGIEYPLILTSQLASERGYEYILIHVVLYDSRTLLHYCCVWL